MALNDNQRHQIVLPDNCLYTKLLFRKEHMDLMHSGPLALVASIRQRYWPLRPRSLARAIEHDCVNCFKLKPQIVQPIMGSLPGSRVQSGRAFAICGVDFAGPVMIRMSLRRKAPCNKGYIFVCFATKAIHIELVSDLSTKTFLQALNRFFDRRGKSSIIYSDNARNFVGMRRHLKEVYALFQSPEHQRSVFSHLADKGIEWRFIPPRAPHFGELWEAAVKTMKSLLYRVLGKARLTYEELLTVLTRVEAVLNSRPITPVSSDPSDLTYLTPGHFLIGDIMTVIPEKDETTTPITHLNRWRIVFHYTQVLWKRWHQEYLSQLQERTKWSITKGPKLQIGIIVLVKETNFPPLKWQAGRVMELHCDDDNVARSARVRTNVGEFSRAVRLLCPLPYEGNSL